MLSSRPLYDTRADAEYFEPPPEWRDLLRAIERRFNVLLVGARGVGKTTLLRQAQLAVRAQEDPTAFVDATAVADPLALAERIRDAVAGRPSGVQAGLRPSIAAVAGDAMPPPAGASRALYDQLDALRGATRAVILVDASGSAEAAYDVFGRMRDVLWQLPHQWVVAIDETDRATLQRPPADSFFDIAITLKPIPTNSLAVLLTRRGVSELDEMAIARIAGAANGNPRRALEAARHSLVHGGDPGEQLDRRGQLLEKAAAVGRPYGMLMAELLDLGQASPSDEALLNRLGISRARATQILRRLLSDGLVTTATERPEGPGRPRTVYLPNLDAA